MKILHRYEDIMNKTSKIADKISEDYKGEQVLVVGVLKGSSIFMSHLFVKIKADAKMDFMTVSSYRGALKSGELKLVQDLDTSVKDKNILIVEDIVDTGKTLSFLIKYLKERGAKDIKIATLINKEKRRKYDFPSPDYICYEYNEDDFLIGFGLDYEERYRNLPDLYQMEEGDF